MRIFGETGCVLLNQEKAVVDLKAQLFSYLSSLPTMEHWEKRFRWEKGIGLRVNWNILGYVGSSVKTSRYLWAVKHSSGFFGCGKMMLRWKLQSDSLCPRCQAPNEDARHVIQCPHVEASSQWMSALQSFEKWLISYLTPREVATAICQRLQAWRSQVPLPELTSLSPAYISAFMDQDEIGWEPFLLGFWALHWQSVQQEYLLSIGSKVSIRRWLSAVIQKLWDIAWDLWSHRNVYLHDADRGRMILQLNNEVSEWYSRGGSHLSRDGQALFQTSLPVLLESSISNKQMWLRRVQLADSRSRRTPTVYAQERASIRRWLQSASESPG